MPHKTRRLAEYILSHIFPANNFATTLQRFAKGSRLRARIALGDFANSDLELDEITGLEALGDDSTAIGKKVECMANAIELGPRGEDGFYRLTPYGRHPYGDGGDLQVVDQAGGDALVRRFDAANSLFVNMMRKGSGHRPIYEGHPDHPVFSSRHGHDNCTIQGEITAIQTRADGIYVKPVWKDAGNELLNSGEKLYWSPRWVTTLTGREQDVRIWRPYKLMSAGLTPTPNIMGCAANSLPKIQTKKKMKLIQDILNRLGFTEPQITAFANSAEGAPADTEIESRLGAQLDMANGYFDLQIALMRALGYADEEIDGLRDDGATAPSLEDLVAKMTAAFGTADQANESLTTAQAELTTEQERVTALTADLANARQAHATLVVENAIEAGRLPEADRVATITQLTESADMANAIADLEKAEAALPTGSVVDGVGKRKGEMQDMANARNTFNRKLEDFANAKGIDLKADYPTAYFKFKKTAEGQELLTQMSESAE
jgi:hypothetical protein